jgi:hypothetical protein
MVDLDNALAVGHNPKERVMTKYAVTICEVVEHYIEVEATDEEAAMELGKHLIENVADEQLVTDNAYAVDSIGWDGYGGAREIV